VHFAWSDDHHDDRNGRRFQALMASVSGCNGSSVSGSNGVTVTICCPSPLPPRVYKYGGGGRSSIYANSLSDALHSAHSCPTFCEHRESGRAGLQNWRPQRYTCTGVRAIMFLGSVLATARFVRSTSADRVHHRRRRSRDCIVYACLHRLCMTTSNIHTRCLV
jgi:hypothetical protein